MPVVSLTEDTIAMTIETLNQTSTVIAKGEIIRQVAARSGHPATTTRAVIDALTATIHDLTSFIMPELHPSANLRADRRFAFKRQQFAIAPHISRPLFDLLAANILGNRRVVVINFERPEIVGAEVDWRFWVKLAADLATKAGGKIGHGGLSLRDAVDGIANDGTSAMSCAGTIRAPQWDVSMD